MTPAWPISRAGVGHAWETYWFQEVPPHIYALLRILFGAIGLTSLLGLTPVSMFWSLEGFAPIPGGGLGIKSELIRLGFGALAGEIFFLGLWVSFALMTVGFLSGWAVAMSFAGTLLQVKWNTLPLSGAHQAELAVLFCLLWADCGAVWSVDARLARRRDGSDWSPEPQPIWPLRMIRFQVALIYLNSGLWKLLSPMWRDGSAVYYTLNLNTFHRFPYQVPPQLIWATTLATYGTLIWEISFPLMVLRPRSRQIALGIGVAIHLGMWVTLELGPFSWVMIAAYAAFLNPEAVKNLRLERPNGKKSFFSIEV